MSDVAKLLQTRDDFLVLTHKNPDGDAVGSAAALCLILRAMGKRAHVFHNPGFTPRFQPFLDGLVREDTAGTVISVDLADAALLPQNAQPLKDEILLAIDHHETHRAYAKHLLLDGHSAACAEIILALADTLSVALTPEMARALYLAIVTDSGCFAYSNTTVNTLNAAARLYPLIPDVAEINYTFCIQKSKKRASLEARLLTEARYYFDSACAVLTVTRALMEELALTEDDLDNLGSIARAIEGVSLAIVLRELENGDTKASLRSAPSVDAAAICAAFGGGGHRAAAGCTICAPCADAESALIKTIEEFGVFPR